MKDVYEKREEIREQIEYDLICTPVNRTQVDEFVELMLEVAMTRSPTIKIGRDAEYPTAFVQERFAQINSSHIEKVLEGISINTTRVWNTRAYLLAALFNAQLHGQSLHHAGQPRSSPRLRRLNRPPYFMPGTAGRKDLP